MISGVDLDHILMFFMVFDDMLMICSLCAYVWGVSAPMLSLIVVCRLIFSKFWRSLEVVF